MKSLRRCDEGAGEVQDVELVIGSIFVVNGSEGVQEVWEVQHPEASIVASQAGPESGGDGGDSEPDGPVIHGKLGVFGHVVAILPSGLGDLVDGPGLDVPLVMVQKIGDLIEVEIG